MASAPFRSCFCDRTEGSQLVMQSNHPTLVELDEVGEWSEPKLNILKKHDDRWNISQYLPQLAAQGYVYQSSLYQTAVGGQPILCAACHSDNALGAPGLAGIALRNWRKMLDAVTKSSETVKSVSAWNRKSSCGPQTFGQI